MAATAKAYKGVGMEGSVARWYDRTTRKSMDDFRELAAQIAAEVPGGRVLEIAPGPGFLSIEMAKRGLDVRAVDISKTFVQIATKNAGDAGVKVDFVHGNAAELPVKSASVDFVVCRAAFKNFAEPVKAMREMLRVLRPTGTALLIDMRRDTTMNDVRTFVDGMGLSWFQRGLTVLSFRPLIKRAYPIDEIRRMAAQAGWTDVQIDLHSMGFAARVRR